MELEAKSIALALAAAQEEKEYYLHQIAQQDDGKESEEFEVHDVIVLVEIIIPALEHGLRENTFNTKDIPRHRVLIMALTSYMARHLKSLSAYEYGALVKLFAGIEDELLNEYTRNLKPEEWPEHAAYIIRERERITRQIKGWRDQRQSSKQSN